MRLASIPRWQSPWATLFLGLSICLGLVACGTPVAPIPSPAITPSQEAADVLHVYNWDTYIDPAVITDFEQQFGVTVDYQTYASNEEMLAAVQARLVAYDIVVPTDYMVAIMRREGLLVPLDQANIPNLRNIGSDFRNPPFDPNNRYCVPYQWGTLGIGYNIEATGREIRGWRDFFDPAYAGRVSMLADPRFSLGAILLYLGYSPNTTSGAEIEAARDFLVAHAGQIAAYAPDTGQDLLAAGEVDLAFEWSGDIFQIMEDNPAIRYVIPEEGSLLWIDSMCIPARAAHKELAETLINYILEAQVGAAISNYTHFSSPNEAALPLINEADRQNPALYPSPEVRERLFSLVDVGSDATLRYEQAWNQVLSAHKP